MAGFCGGEADEILQRSDCRGDRNVVLLAIPAARHAALCVAFHDAGIICAGLPACLAPSFSRGSKSDQSEFLRRLRFTMVLDVRRYRSLGPLEQG